MTTFYDFEDGCSFDPMVPQETAWKEARRFTNKYGDLFNHPVSQVQWHDLTGWTYDPHLHKLNQNHPWIYRDLCYTTHFQNGPTYFNISKYSFDTLDQIIMTEINERL